MFYQNTTETMAKLAWRYGENGAPHRQIGGCWMFLDGSWMCLEGSPPGMRGGIHTARSFRYLREGTHGE